jgi:metallo-beta-lactamase class B
MYRSWILGLVCSLLSIAAASAVSIKCSQCEAWNKDQAPFQMFGNTYYVGTRGLSSVLIVSAAGHVLIDGALPQSAPLIARHVEQLGFRMSDVKVILNSHVHFDHAGGIAELQKMSGARVIASDIAANVLRSGRIDRSDPQYGYLIPYVGPSTVEALGEQEALDLGTLHLNVIHTPGHTPGGTSWTWKSCEGGRCLNVVYGDSLNAVSDDSFKYSGDPRYPRAAADMLGSIAALDAVPCDILVAAHPEFTALWSVFDEHGKGSRAQLIDSSACKRYAAAAKARIDKRLEDERKK